MTEKDFDKVFGERADHERNYYWMKFKEVYKGDPGKFICYLDNGNMDALFAHFKAHIKRYGVK